MYPNTVYMSVKLKLLLILVHNGWTVKKQMKNIAEWLLIHIRTKLSYNERFPRRNIIPELLSLGFPAAYKRTVKRLCGPDAQRQEIQISNGSDL